MPRNCTCTPSRLCRQCNSSKYTQSRFAAVHFCLRHYWSNPSPKSFGQDKTTERTNPLVDDCQGRKKESERIHHIRAQLMISFSLMAAPRLPRSCTIWPLLPQATHMWAPPASSGCCKFYFHVLFLVFLFSLYASMKKSFFLSSWFVFLHSVICMSSSQILEEDPSEPVKWTLLIGQNDSPNSDHAKGPISSAT